MGALSPASRAEERAKKAAYMRSYLAVPEHRAKKNARERANRARSLPYMRRYRATHRVRIVESKTLEYQNNKRDLRAFKLLRGCIDCGYRENADALQLDHVRGVKLAPVTTFYISKPRLLRELAKCEVRCANCHAIVTASRRVANTH